jgi:hypothetical protein
VVRNREGDFKIQPKGAIVEIGRADGGERIIHEQGFLMQKATGKAMNVNVRMRQLGEHRKRGQPYEHMIRLHWQQDADLHPADRR